MPLLSLTYKSDLLKYDTLTYESIIDTKSSDLTCPLDNYKRHIEQINKLQGNNYAVELLKKMSVEAKISEDDFGDLQNKLNDTNNLDNTLLNLILLGHISAVESYLREIVTKIINIDKYSFEKCADLNLSFLAANSHPKNTLAESLLEYKTFIEKKDIINLFDTFIGIKFDVNTLEILEEFEKICNLRHVIIHRFSKIGIKNLKKLDLHGNKKFLEKKLVLNYKFIQDSTKVCEYLVNNINQTIAEKVIIRKFRDENVQKIPHRAGLHEFKKYAKIFYSKDIQLDFETEFSKIKSALKINNQ